ncbi:MAG TPA: hypothetical protein DEB48_04395 [Verrucomicrobiales bacterium]|nr:hypothetical protein [Verrucomicrobiales bacterium]
MKQVIKNIRPNAWMWVAAAFVLTFLLELELWARLGGGGGYSGGGGGSGGGYSGGGGGGSGDGGEAIVWWIQFSFKYPWFGIPANLVIFYFYYVVHKNKTETIVVAHEPTPPPNWDIIRAQDENFSAVLFRDFAYTLFSKVHEARGDRKLKNMGQFLGTKAMEALERLQLNIEDVHSVIVGAMTVSDLSRAHRGKLGDVFTLRLNFEANYTEVVNGKEQAVYTSQNWYFCRKASALSREPDRIASLDCIGCGSSFEPDTNGTCQHCGQHYEPGEAHWRVDSIYQINRRQVGPALTSSAPDVGLNLETLFAPDYWEQKQRIEEENTDFKVEEITERFKYIFNVLQSSWSDRNLNKLRAFETDHLFQNHSYWVREYERQGLRNILTNIDLEKIQVVKIRSDKFYDAITCRMWAGMVDYTITNSGDLVCGNRSKRKHFSEYWTFIRGRGVKSHGKTESQCPNCGAELRISMAGECEYCGSKLTSGEFDWVLSEIQQDEEYTG